MKIKMRWADTFAMLLACAFAVWLVTVFYFA